MKTIVAGSRNFFAYNRVEEIIEASGFDITQLISGCSVGVDKLGEMWAKNHNIPVRYFSNRNIKMIDKADALIAIYNSETSNGTVDIIKQAMAKDLRVYIYDLLDGTIKYESNNNVS